MKRIDAHVLRGDAQDALTRREHSLSSPATRDPEESRTINFPEFQSRLGPAPGIGYQTPGEP
jgi:hypothetical protein